MPVFSTRIELQSIIYLSSSMPSVALPSSSHRDSHADSISIYLSLNTATRPRGHFRQVSAASVSIRQEKIKYRQMIKSMIVKDKNR